MVDLVERLDHAMALNSEDPQLDGLRTIGERVLLFDGQDPTTEVLRTRGMRVEDDSNLIQAVS